MTVIEAFRTAMEAKDLAAVTATFAEDVVLHSPAVIATEYAGRERVSRITGFAAQTLGDIRFTDELHGSEDRSHGLVFEATVGDQRAQGIFYLRTDDGGIVSLTLLLRPLRAVEAFVQAMGARGAEPALDFSAGNE
jgi:limonene-1,2-epoxide hydrolase